MKQLFTEINFRYYLYILRHVKTKESASKIDK